MLYPAKLVSFFVRARILRQQSVHDQLQSALSGFLNLPQMGEQLLLHRQEAVLDRFMLPQEGPAHPPILVQGTLFGAFQFEIGNPVVSALDIGQFGFHCQSSFCDVYFAMFFLLQL